MLSVSIARPATSCADEVIAAPSAITRAQAISDTLQPASNMFVCRVDGTGVATNGSTDGTRSVTPTGFVLLVVARWLHFVGYALGFGTIWFAMWIAAARGVTPERVPLLWRIVRFGIVLLLSAEPLALLAQTIGVRGALFDPALAGDVLASGFGLVWAQRIGVALLLWVIVGAIHDGAPQALWAVPALGLALALIDSTASASLTALAIAATMLHEAAMAAWMGGLALLLALWNGLDQDRRAAALGRFGQLSGVAIGVLAVSGVALAGMHLTQLSELFTTFYGVTLAIKLLAALIAIGMAGFGRRMYRQAWRGRVTLAVLVVVVGVAGLLVSLPSPSTRFVVDDLARLLSDYLLFNQLFTYH
jgi:copper transport protein